MVTMDGVSRELCGGTHVTSTGQIGLVRITGEESVSAGTRRISAVTGAKALDRFRQAEQALAESAAVLKVPVQELSHRLTAVVKELRDLKKAKPAAAAAGTSPDDLLARAVDVGGTRVVVAEAKGCDAGAMRQCIDQLRRKASPIAVLLAAADGDKVTLVAGISRELEARGLSAGDWIKDPATIVGGKGGGKPDLAQAGGKLVDKLPAALDAARQSIEARLRA
jgi:alanyl-tRNA synthetase